MHLIIDDIVHVSNSFEFLSWSFVPRDGNKVAQELAHCLPWVIGRKIWLGDFPHCIAPLLESELSTNAI